MNQVISPITQVLKKNAATINLVLLVLVPRPPFPKLEKISYISNAFFRIRLHI